VHWSYDGVSVGIDEHANEQKPTDEADLLINFKWLSGYDAPQAVTPSDAWIESAISYDAANDPDSQTSHAIYELAIPMQTFVNPSAIRVSVWDPSRNVNMHWPTYEGSWSSKYFGDLIFSQEQETTIHEERTKATAVGTVPLLTVVVLMVLVVLVLLYLRRRHRVSAGQARD
jgi:hypothetical protein